MPCTLALLPVAGMPMTRRGGLSARFTPPAPPPGRFEPEDGEGGDVHPEELPDAILRRREAGCLLVLDEVVRHQIDEPIDVPGGQRHQLEGTTHGHTSRPPADIMLPLKDRW